MLLLALDTCDARGSIALLHEGGTIAESSHPATEDYSSWLIPAIDRLLIENAVSHAGLTGYAVTSGPGSFTGVRVGLTTAKAWAETYGKPIFPVSRLRVLVDKAPELFQHAAVFIDAQRQQVFAALYRRENGQWNLLGDESVIDPNTFFERALSVSENEALSWVTLDPQLLEGSASWRPSKRGGRSIIAVSPPLASAVGRYAFTNLLDKGIDAIALDANYVRRSDAEIFGKKAVGT